MRSLIQNNTNFLTKAENKCILDNIYIPVHMKNIVLFVTIYCMLVLL